MPPEKSQWQTSQLTAAYLSGVRAAIPGADLQLALLRMICLAWFPAPAHLLDLGCGDGILGRLLLDAFPQAQAVFVDFSEPMLAAAREKLGANPRAVVVNADYAAPDWLDRVQAHVPFEIIVSGFSIHHQPDERKKSLYAEIHTLLSPGGVFLNLEHVASATPAGEQLFDQLFIDQLYDFQRRAGKETTREIVAENYHHRPDKIENILAPVNEQCRWLTEIGFRDVDCFFKIFELALFGGRKALPA